MNGDILRIGNNDYYFRAKMVGAHLIISYKVDASPEMTISALAPSSDALWYMANITEEDMLVTLTLYNLDSPDVVISNVSESRPASEKMLDSLVRNFGPVQIGLGSYQGCLQQVRIQGILLPFFNDESFTNNTSVERFILQSGSSFTHGCKRNSNCGTNTCAQGTSCVEDYFTYTCNCSVGYSGRWCQSYTNYCDGVSCVHGVCVNKLDGHVCECYPGYYGES